MFYLKSKSLLLQLLVLVIGHFIIPQIYSKSLPNSSKTTPQPQPDAFLSPSRTTDKFFTTQFTPVLTTTTSRSAAPSTAATITTTTPTPSTSRDKGGTSNDNQDAVDNLVIEEVCDEGPENVERNDKSWRKERLMCALLRKMMAKSMKSTKSEDQTRITTSSGFPKIPNTGIIEDEQGSLIPPNYDKEVPPKLVFPVVLPNGTKTFVKKPVEIYTFLNIRSVRDVNEQNEQITLDMDIFLMWVDGRIVESILARNITLDKITNIEDHLDPMSAKMINTIWIPDAIFEETVSVARPVVLDKLGRAAKFNPRIGATILRSRLLITLHCDMNFAYYPGDTQKCGFHFRSDALDSVDVRFKWLRSKVHGIYLHETSDPNFDYQVEENIKEYLEATNLGPETRFEKPHSYLWFEIRIRRNMSYHLLQTYLPSLFFLIVTWLCFLIPTKLFEARVGVAMTTLLTQTSMFSSIRENTPTVGYVKAIDVWMVTCIVFIFLALLVFTVGAWIRHARERMRALKAELEDRKNRLRKTENLSKPLRLYKIIERDIEKYTVISLSLFFLLFIIGYWTWVLKGSEHFNWKVNATFNNIS